MSTSILSVIATLVAWVAVCLVGPWCQAAHAQWSAPINAGSAINSRQSEGQPHLSPDGLTLYFSSNRREGSGGWDIWVAQRETIDSEWDEAVPLGFNTGKDEASPALSTDGFYLFFYSDRPGGCGGQDIWKAKRTDVSDPLTWEPPTRFACTTLNSSAQESGPGVFRNPTTGIALLYFASNRLNPRSYEAFDIYASTLGSDGAGDAPVLIQNINSSGHDGGPSLTCNGLTMYFHSDRPEGVGEQDLWMTSRPSILDLWSPPLNLGDVVNGRETDHGPHISCDGSVLFFDSTRSGGVGDRDIWFSERTSAEED